MPRFQRWLSLAVTLTVAVSTAAQAQTPAPQTPMPIGDCTRLTVTGHPDDAPIAWRDGNRLDGAGIALAGALARSLGITATTRVAETWISAQDMTADGTVDLIVGLYRTPDREPRFTYVATSFANDPVGVFVRRDDVESIGTLADLAARPGAGTVGERFGEPFDSTVGAAATFRRTSDLQTAMGQLNRREIDFVVASLYPGLAHLRRTNGLPAIGVTHRGIVSGQGLHMAFAPTSPCRQRAADFAAGIAEARLNGAIDGLIAEALVRWSATQR